MSEKIKKIRITQRRSKIGAHKKQKATLDALGLRKMNQTVIHRLTPEIKGMVRQVNHLLLCEIIETKS